MASDSEDEWKYAIDEVGEDDADDTDGEGGKNGDGVANSESGDSAGRNETDGAETDRRRIEPGSMNAENVAFVVLGVLIAVGTIAYGLGIL